MGKRLLDNRVIQTTNALQQSTWSRYDAVGNITEAEDALHRITRSYYDADNRLIRSVDPLRNETRTVDRGIGTSYLLGRVASVGDVTTGYAYLYDEAGRVTFVAENLGDATLALSFEYDLAGNRTLAGDDQGTHDARLVAALLRHRIPNILTFNGVDFARSQL